MIEEVLKDIAEAEERAEEIRRDAVARCKEKVFAVESAAEALKTTQPPSARRHTRRQSLPPRKGRRLSVPR